MALDERGAADSRYCATLPQVGDAVAGAWRDGVGLWIESPTLAALAERVGAEVHDGVGRLHFGPGRRGQLDRLASRVLQWVVAATVLLLGLPVWVLLGLVVLIADRRWPLHVGLRTGQRGTPFSCVKLRTMQVGAENGEHLRERRDFIRGEPPLFVAKGRPVVKNPVDPRVTPVGRLLRRTSLDEVPQFLHVLTGRMNVVGPRPYVVEETEAFAPWHRSREACLPGITGLWQINGRSEVSFDESVVLDLYYMSNASFWFDLHIMLITPWRMLMGVGGY